MRLRQDDIDYYSDGLISCCYVVDNPVASFNHESDFVFAPVRGLFQ